MKNRLKGNSIKKIFIMCAIAAMPLITSAQIPYKNAIGLRAGETSGLTIKHALNGNAALEGIVGIWSHALGVTVLYEIHKSTSAAHLNWYYGGGGHIRLNSGSGYWIEDKKHYWYYRGYAGNTVGIDGILGLELQIPGAPIALSADIKPMVEFYRGYGAYTSLDPGLGFKVTF